MERMKTLEGQTILVTRPRDRVGSLVDQIQQRGGLAKLLPLIKIEPPDSWLECDRALGRLNEFSAIAFTSVSAVIAFFERCRLLGIDFDVFGKLQLYAIGSQTAGAVEEFGLRVRKKAEVLNGADLARALEPEE